MNEKGIIPVFLSLNPRFLETLIQHFQSFLPFSDPEIALILSKSTTRTLKRRQYVLQEHFICRHYTFMVKGCLKMYSIDPKGTEHNIQFAAENDWITDIDSFYTQKPSRLFIEAVEPSEIIQIEQENLYFLFTEIPKLNRIFKVIIEHKYVELQNRVLQSISSTAQQRYLYFLEQYPHLSSRLPNTQIASYLGITPEFLSKIRRELSQKPPGS